MVTNEGENMVTDEKLASVAAAAVQTLESRQDAHETVCEARYKNIIGRQDAIEAKVDLILKIAPTSNEKRAVLVFALTCIASIIAKMLGVHLDVPALLP